MHKCSNNKETGREGALKIELPKFNDLKMLLKIKKKELIQTNVTVYDFCVLKKYTITRELMCKKKEKHELCIN